MSCPIAYTAQESKLSVPCMLMQHVGMCAEVGAGAAVAAGSCMWAAVVESCWACCGQAGLHHGTPQRRTVS